GIIFALLRVTLWRNYAETLARLAIRRAYDVKGTRLHVDCGSHTQPGHRREHGDLQHRQRAVVESAAVPQRRAAGDHLDAFARRECRARLAFAWAVLRAQVRKQRL